MTSLHSARVAILLSLLATQLACAAKTRPIILQVAVSNEQMSRALVALRNGITALYDTEQLSSAAYERILVHFQQVNRRKLLLDQALERYAQAAPGGEAQYADEALAELHLLLTVLPEIRVLLPPQLQHHAAILDLLAAVNRTILDVTYSLRRTP
jgi:hypothetical protein